MSTGFSSFLLGDGNNVILRHYKWYFKLIISFFNNCIGIYMDRHKLFLYIYCFLCFGKVWEIYTTIEITIIIIYQIFPLILNILRKSQVFIQTKWQNTIIFPPLKLFYMLRKKMIGKELLQLQFIYLNKNVSVQCQRHLW